MGENMRHGGELLLISASNAADTVADCFLLVKSEERKVKCSELRQCVFHFSLFTLYSSLISLFRSLYFFSFLISLFRLLNSEWRLRLRSFEIEFHALHDE